MRFETKAGRRFVLGHYSLAEWADIQQQALVVLGCSEEYAAAHGESIRTARSI